VARRNPIAGFAPTVSGPHNHDRETIVTRRLLMAGHARIEVGVKVVLDGRVYIAVEKVQYLPANKSCRPRVIKRGAVLVANHWLGGGDPLFAVYNNGIFDALRAVGEHVPDTEASELLNLRVASGNLDTILALTWSVRRSSPRHEQEDLRYNLRNFVERRRRWLNTFKRESLEFAGRAADKTGHIPFPALSPMVGAAERRLGFRRAEVRDIVKRIGERQAALLVILDQAWEFRGWLWKEFGAMLARFTPQQRFAKGSVNGMTRRLSHIALLCADVSLAPFGRRSFSYIAIEAARAAELLWQDKHLEAKALLERCTRSLFLVAMKREIHEIMITILAVKRLGLPTSVDAIQDIVFGIEAIRVYMTPALDSDFTLPVSDKCAAALARAVAVLRSDDPKRLDLAYKFLRQAQEPI
jgi:hypothetical protein